MHLNHHWYYKYEHALSTIKKKPLVDFNSHKLNLKFTGWYTCTYTSMINHYCALDHERNQVQVENVAFHRNHTEIKQFMRKETNWPGKVLILRIFQKFGRILLIRLKTLIVIYLLINGLYFYSQDREIRQNTLRNRRCE